MAKTSAGNTRSPAGAVRWVEGDRVFVDVGMPSSIDGDLIASNNLSDVANAATARANIGANKLTLAIQVPSFLSEAEFGAIVAPVAGTIVAVHVVLLAANLADGSVTLALRKNGDAVTDGDVEFAATAEVGDIEVAAPTGNNVVAAGDLLFVLVLNGDNTAAAKAVVSLEMTT